VRASPGCPSVVILSQWRGVSTNGWPPRDALSEGQEARTWNLRRVSTCRRMTLESAARTLCLGGHGHVQAAPSPWAGCPGVVGNLYDNVVPLVVKNDRRERPPCSATASSQVVSTPDGISFEPFPGSATRPWPSALNCSNRARGASFLSPFVPALSA